jgi:AcrR family transcriptional regulator
LPRTADAALSPRKTPVQARSSASVNAILQATLQVLLAVGKERLTTTRVAARAGVSVGTLYQYFPNKSSLLQACLRHHLDDVVRTMEEACEEYAGRTLSTMAQGVVAAFVEAKIRHVKASAALYAVSSDVDGAAIAQAAHLRAHQAVVHLFSTASDMMTKDPETVASVVLAAANGIVRRLLEMKSPERQLEPMREELFTLIRAYTLTCVQQPLRQSPLA